MHWEARRQVRDNWVVPGSRDNVPLCVVSICQCSLQLYQLRVRGCARRLLHPGAVRAVHLQCPCCEDQQALRRRCRLLATVQGRQHLAQEAHLCGLGCGWQHVDCMHYHLQAPDPGGQRSTCLLSMLASGVGSPSCLSSLPLCTCRIWPLGVMMDLGLSNPQEPLGMTHKDVPATCVADGVMLMQWLRVSCADLKISTGMQITVPLLAHPRAPLLSLSHTLSPLSLSLSLHLSLSLSLSSILLHSRSPSLSGHQGTCSLHALHLLQQPL